MLYDSDSDNNSCPIYDILIKNSCLIYDILTKYVIVFNVDCKTY